MITSTPSRAPIPATAGIGLRAPHTHEVLAAPGRVAWVEVHSENYFMAGGPARALLAALRRELPVSVHGVGLSLGSADAIDRTHLARLQRLVAWLEPAFVSEHLSWSAIGGDHLNDLLPLPYTEESLATFVDHVTLVQDVLGRRILIENISSYLSYRHSTIPEGEFLAEIVRRTGCGVLLDVNNLYVNEVNRKEDARAYMAALPADSVAEIHLAGHTAQIYEGGSILVDTHSRPVCDAVWALYRLALARFGSVPTLIEWDSDLPPFEILLAEAERANVLLGEIGRARAA